jgi:hypothetical protein
VVTDELKESGFGQAAAAALGDDKPRAKKGSNDRQSADGKPPEDDPNKGERRDRHAEKRIRRLQRQLASERDRNNANDQRIAKLETELTGIKARSTADAPKEPELKDFKDAKEYAKAYAKWERETEAAKKGGSGDGKKPDGEGKPPAKQPDSRQAKAPDEEQLERFFKDGKKKLGDEFLLAQEAAAANEFAINQVMGDFILDSEHGHAIFVYLSDHPKLSRRIYDKSETFAVKALEELEEKAKAGELIDEEGGLEEGGEEEDDDDDAGGKRDRKTGRYAKKRDDEERGDGTETRGDGQRREKGSTRAPKPSESGKDRGGGGKKVDLETADMDDYAAIRAKEEAERLKRH